MSSFDFTITSSPKGGGLFDIAWDAFNGSNLEVAFNNEDTVTGVYLILNDITGIDPVTETQLTFLDFDELLLPSFECQLAIGGKYYAMLRFVTRQGLNLFSNYLTIISTSVPEKCIIHSVLSAGDGKFIINLSNQYVHNTITDGFSKINKVYCWVTGIQDSLQPTLTFSKRYILNVSSNNEVPNYSTLLELGSEDLENNLSYEVMIRVENSVGLSIISDTLILTPRDVPQEIDDLSAMPQSVYESNKSLPFTNHSGSIVVRWTQVVSASLLVDSGAPVNKYTIKRQEVSRSSNSAPWVNVGEAVLTELDLTEEGVLNSIQVEEDGYEFKYILQGNNNNLGKFYVISVSGSNMNGQGPYISSDVVASYDKPSQPEFVLKQLSSDNGFGLMKQDVSLIVSMESLPSMNYSEAVEGDFVLPSAPNPEPLNTPLVLGSPNLVNTKVRVEIQLQNEVSPNNYTYELIASGNVDLEPVFERVRYSISGYGWRINSYVLNSDNLFVNGQNQLFNNNDDGRVPLTSALIAGVKYVVNMASISIDPLRSFNEPLIYSNTASKMLSMYKSIDRVALVQLYALDVDGQYFTSPKLRLKFQQLSDNVLYSCGVTNFESVQYFPVLNNVVREDLAVSHNSNVNDVDIILNIDDGLGVSQSVRMGIYFPVNRDYIPDNGVEKIYSNLSCSKTETAITELGAVSVPEFNMPSAENVEIKFYNVSQVGLSQSGISSSNVFSRVYLYKDNNNGHASLVSTSSMIPWEETQSTVSFSGLDMGQKYLSVVSNFVLYDKQGLEDTKEFDNYEAHSSNPKYVSFRAAVSAGVVRNLEVISSNGSIKLMYDEPALISSYGLSISEIAYSAIVSEINSSSISEHVPNVTISTTGELTLNRAYRYLQDGNNRDNAIQITNGRTYYYTLRADATLPNEYFSFEALTNDNSIGQVSGTSQSFTFDNLSIPPISARNINGLPTALSSVWVDNGPNSPANLTAASANGRVSLSFSIPDDATGFECVANSNDAININNEEIASFKSSDFGTLAALRENPFPNNANFDYSYVLSDLTVIHTVTFKQLVNGDSINFEVYSLKHSINGITHSEPVSIISSPSAPPSDITSTYFTVDSQKINAHWSRPDYDGGASTLLYKVNLFMVVNNQGVFVDNLVPLDNNITEQLSYEFSNLINGNDYKVSVLPFYLRNTVTSGIISVEGNSTQINPNNNNLIRVNPAPISPSLDVIAGNNSINVSITKPHQGEFDYVSNYPIEQYKLYASLASNPEIVVLVSTFNDVVNGANTRTLTLNNLGESNQLSNENGILNGLEYQFYVESVTNYSYAQAVPNGSRSSVTPFGALNVSSITNRVDNKSFGCVVSCNGNKSIVSIIAIAKLNNNLLVVKNLSEFAQTLPSLSFNGSQTSSLAALQNCEFVLNFADVINNEETVSEVFVAVSNTVSSDGMAWPSDGTFNLN